MINEVARLAASSGEALAEFAPPAALAGPALTGVIDDGVAPANLAASGGAITTESHATAVDPIERMRSLIAERQDETLEILRGWMEEPEGNR